MRLHWLYINMEGGNCSFKILSYSRQSSTHLTGVGVGAFTCLTGDGDCWRPPATLATSEVGDLDAGLGGTLGGVLWASCWIISALSTCICMEAWKLASILWGGRRRRSDTLKAHYSHWISHLETKYEKETRNATYDDVIQIYVCDVGQLGARYLFHSGLTGLWDCRSWNHCLGFLCWNGFFTWTHTVEFRKWCEPDKLTAAWSLF